MKARDKFAGIPIILLWMLCAGFTECQAQTFKHRIANADEVPPKVLLVELPTQRNRIAALLKAGLTEKALQVQKAGDIVFKNMLADFNDHFTFCPIYYFIDTNAQLVKEQKFEGIILDKSLQPIPNTSAIPRDSNGYFIVFFGYGFPEERYNTRNFDIMNVGIGGNPRQTIIALDWHLQELPYHLPYKPYPTAPYNRLALKKQNLANYYYRSKRFDICYYPHARYYNLTLRQFYQ